MRFQAYPKYKTSSVEWLGDVPEQWTLTPLRHVCRFAYGDSLAAENREDGEVSVFGSNGAVGTHTIGNTYGPVIVVGRKGSHGKVNWSRFPVFAIDTTYFIDSRHTQSNLRWLYYLLDSLRLDAVSKDSAVPGLAREDAYQNVVAIPSPCDQRAIADFLDAEAAKLDTLVAKKQELIEKLKEERSALISRAVTRGLPPEAARAAGFRPNLKLKPSGIEWLGEIPEHWEVLQLRRRWLVLDCKHLTVPFIDDGIPLASIREVQGFEVELSNAKQTTEENYLEMTEGEREPRLGDIIYSRNATVGAAALVTTTARFCMGQDVCLIRSKVQVPKYVLYLFRSSALIEQVESLMIGSTFRRINVGQIKSFWVCVPPIAEQRAIAAYLDRETNKIDRMVLKAEAAIERLQEYRTALITAAVTGKIDLRNVGHSGVNRNPGGVEKEGHRPSLV